jgi:hypothetical protein
MSLQAKQLNYMLVGGIVLLCSMLAGIAYATNVVLGGEADKLSKLKADSSVLDTQQTTLAKNKQDITKYSELNTIAQTIVPQDKDQAEAIREIVSLANASGIGKLSSITFPASTLGATAGLIANPNLTQLTPVPGITGVYELPITIVQDQSARVTYGQFITFLGKIEQNRRTAQVGSISVQPDTSNPNNVAFTLVVNEFIKP